MHSGNTFWSLTLIWQIDCLQDKVKANIITLQTVLQHEITINYTINYTFTVGHVFLVLMLAVMAMVAGQWSWAVYVPAGPGIDLVLSADQQTLITS